MSDVSGLHAGVFFLDRRGGLPMQKKKKKGEKQNVQQKSMHIFGAFISPVFGAIGGVTFELAKHISLYNVHTA